MSGGYLENLMNLVGADDDLSLLCNFMLNFDFTWSMNVDMDYNRADDGLYLRTQFAPCEKSGDVSVLEVLVALAVRIDRDIMGEPDQRDAARWFYEMLQNLGLSYMTNEYFDAEYVNEKISRWVNRDYHPNGEGSLFPLKRSNVDQRTLPIWVQMNEYLIENY